MISRLIFGIIKSFRQIRIYIQIFNFDGVCGPNLFRTSMNINLTAGV